MKILFKDHPEFLDWYLNWQRIRMSIYVGLDVEDGKGRLIKREDQVVGPNSRVDFVEDGAGELFSYLKEHFPEALL